MTTEDPGPEPSSDPPSLDPSSAGAPPEHELYSTLLARADTVAVKLRECRADVLDRAETKLPAPALRTGGYPEHGGAAESLRRLFFGAIRGELVWILGDSPHVPELLDAFAHAMPWPGPAFGPEPEDGAQARLVAESERFEEALADEMDLDPNETGGLAEAWVEAARDGFRTAVFGDPERYGREPVLQPHLIKRFFAVLLDYSIPSMISFILGTALLISGHDGSVTVQNGRAVLVTFIWMLVNAVSIHRVGTTMGKRALGLWVEDARDGERVGLWRAVLRESVGRFVVGLFCGLFALLAVGDDARRTAADHMARTRVVLRAGPDTAARRYFVLALAVFLVAGFGIVSVRMSREMWAIQNRTNEQLGQTWRDQDSVLSVYEKRETHGDDQLRGDLDSLIGGTPAMERTLESLSDMAARQSREWYHSLHFRHERALADTIYRERIEYAEMRVRWAYEYLAWLDAPAAQKDSLWREQGYLRGDADAIAYRLRMTQRRSHASE